MPFVIYSQSTSCRGAMQVISQAECPWQLHQVDTGFDNHCSRWTELLESDCGRYNKMDLERVVHRKRQRRDSGFRKPPNMR